MLQSSAQVCLSGPRFLSSFVLLSSTSASAQGQFQHLPRLVSHEIAACNSIPGMTFRCDYVQRQRRDTPLVKFYSVVFWTKKKGGTFV